MFTEYLTQYRDSILNGNTDNGICFDGAVNPEIYFAKKPRLMFLLKETNGNNNDGTENTHLYDWAYMDWVGQQARREVPLYRSVYRNIAMWSKQFDMYTSGITPKMSDFIDTNGLFINNELCAALNGIAIVNLKKSWGKQTTDYKLMRQYLDSDPVRKEIVLHQVNVLNPHLVLCGGNFDFVYDIFGCGTTVYTIRFDDGQVMDYFERGDMVFASCYHPSTPGWSREASYKHADNIFNWYFNMN